MKYGIDPDILYTATGEAPSLIKSSSASMKKARREGKLHGYPAPPYMKLGTADNARILYRGRALIDYLDQFEERHLTASTHLGVE